MTGARGAFALLALALGALVLGAAWRPTPEPPRVRRVSIAGFEYRPATLEVTAGDTVEWTNADLVTHSASADDRRAFDSPDLAPRASWRTVARTRGTFAYTCALHPTMKGTLVVR